jgi:type I restriction enzyme S subunit
MSSLVPEGWKIKSLADVTHNLDGKRVPLKSTDRALRQGQYRYFGASGVIDYVDDYIFDGEYILLGEDGENVISRVLPLAFKVSGQFWVNNHAHVMQPTSGHDIGYICEFLESLDYSIIASGSAQPKVTQGELKKIKVHVPPLPEQQKIAKILTSVDEVIDKTQAQIDKLKDLKTGMMQELLTNGIGHTEFKDSPVGRIPAEWEVVLVGDITDVIDPQPDHRTPAEVEGGIPYIGLGDIDKSGKINFSGARKVSQAAYDKQCKGFEIHEKAFIFGKIGTIGNPSILPETRFYCLSANIVLVTTPNLLNMRYLFQIFTSDVINNQVLIQTNTTSQPALGIKKVRDFLIPMPTDEREKKKIIGTLRTIDEKIDAVSKKLIISKTIKKALMQDLLTGKVRVSLEKVS